MIDWIRTYGYDVWEIIRDGNYVTITTGANGERRLKAEKDFTKDERMMFEKNRKVKVVI